MLTDVAAAANSLPAYVVDNQLMLQAPGKLFFSACLPQDENKSLPVWEKSRPGAIGKDTLPDSTAALLPFKT